MALARIITRSHQYAQQLALDLLARGYTVEMVSPEEVPNTPADLELRVEAGGNEVQEAASDIQEELKTSKSIEYLQRLKPLMADLLRKWPARAEAKQNTSENTSQLNFNAEADSCGDVELPSREYRPHSPSEPAFDDATFESARLIATPARKPSSPASSIFSITGEPISWADSEPERGGRSEIWFWRAAVGFACMALAILVLGMALRKSPPVAANESAPAGTQTVAATTQPSPVAPIAKPSAATAMPLPAKAAVIPAVVPAAAVAKARPAAAVRRTRVGQNNEVVNGDTTVTYFNMKAAEPPKAAASQASAIKHYSDLD